MKLTLLLAKIKNKKKTKQEQIHVIIMHIKGKLRREKKRRREGCLPLKRRGEKKEERKLRRID
jgi:hypothetical protein